LKEGGIPVQRDNNKYNKHQKVFNIDGKTVITGSFNPTKNGDTRNDENLLIIHDQNIAEKFEEEFAQLTEE
ncbi:phospholipase, partial [Candidatus Woesearchaeota archaeon]|nr:phospholipase [Candidatus Woesearchaeota archaeon]